MTVDSDAILAAIRDHDPMLVEVFQLRLVVAAQEQQLHDLRAQLATYESTSTQAPSTWTTGRLDG